MFTKKGFKKKLIIGGSGLGVLGMVLLLQCNAGKQSINTTSPPSTIQTPPDTQRQWVKPPSTLKTPQQGAQTGPSQSKKLENVPTATNVPDTVTPLDGEDTIRSLVDSFSDEDIKAMEKLTLLDVLSDEELDQLDRKVVKYLKETEVVIPRMIRLRSMAGKLEAALRLHVSGPPDQISQAEQKRMIKKIDEVYDELDSLRKRAAELDAFLTDRDITSIQDVIDTDKIERLFKELWEGKGWDWYKPRPE